MIRSKTLKSSVAFPCVELSKKAGVEFRSVHEEFRIVHEYLTNYYLNLCQHNQFIGKAIGEVFSILTQETLPY